MPNRVFPSSVEKTHRETQIGQEEMRHTVPATLKHVSEAGTGDASCSITPEVVTVTQEN